MNPKDILKGQFLKVVDNQLQENKPPETAQTLQRLKDEGYSEKDAKLLIAQCVALEIFEVMKSNQPFNKERYVHNLNRLPETPSEETE